MLRNCARCGKLHNNLCKYCKECYEIERDIYHRVRDYVWENPNATIEEIHRQTNVSRKKIRQYVREDRFIVTNRIFLDKDYDPIELAQGQH